jgi:hypothetical protein
MIRQPLPSDYRPYDSHAAFVEGIRAYAEGKLISPYNPDSVQTQAYDRGLDYAMRLKRWGDEVSERNAA